MSEINRFARQSGAAGQSAACGRNGGQGRATEVAMSKLLVVGALGLVGRAVVERFAGRADVPVIGLARRRADFAPGATWVQADLQDAAATRAALAQHAAGITHVVYAALNEQPGLVQGWRSAHNMALNTRMLAHLLAAIEGAPLQHVTPLQGTKAYGVHTGRAMRVPAREGDALRDHVNFYFDQQDLVKLAPPATASAGPCSARRSCWAWRWAAR